MTMFLETDKTGDGARNGACPYKDKESPTPKAVIAHRHKSDRGVGAGYMPVDGGMVPSTHPLFPFAALWKGMVDRRSYIRAYHAHQV